jgi:hypothetical protein
MKRLFTSTFAFPSVTTIHDTKTLCCGAAYACLVMMAATPSTVTAHTVQHPRQAAPVYQDGEGSSATYRRTHPMNGAGLGVDSAQRSERIQSFAAPHGSYDFGLYSPQE